MRALVLTDYKRLEVAAMPDPEIGAGEVLVQVKACGICGSDVHGYDGRTGRRIPPLIMGHEAAGVVVQTGANARQFSPGERVTFDSTVYCGTCFFCRRGNVNLCDRRNVLGVSCSEYRRHGAFAEYVAVPEHILYRLPDELSFEQAALVEAVSIAFHAKNRTPIRLGDSVVVVGVGMIGQLIVQTARRSGCGTLIAIDLDSRKLEMAQKFGADVVIDANTPDVLAQIHQWTQGRGADVAFEAVGASGPFNMSVAALRKGGSVTLVGNLAPQVEMPLQQIVTRELTLIGTCASSGEYPACIDLMARGLIDVKPFISAFAPLEDGPAWFDRLYRQEPGLMKVVLRPV